MSLDDEDGALSVARRTTAPLAAACVILSIVCLLLSGFILYIFCSKKYKLNWYERNLLEASKNQVGFEPPLSCLLYCHIMLRHVILSICLRHVISYDIMSYQARSCSGRLFSLISIRIWMLIWAIVMKKQRRSHQRTTI